MNLQPPDRNNPANPLMKVAALTLGGIDLGAPETQTLRGNRIRRVQIIANLNFKRSNDMRGHAKSIDDRPITVCFSMAIRRASFELCASFEGQNKKLARISDVAHLSPLEAKYSVKDETVVTQESGKGYKLSGGGVVHLDTWAPTAAGGASASGEAKGGRRIKKVQKRTGAFHQDNISVTHGGNMVHWELSPAYSDAHSDMPILEGEVFQSPTTGENVPACIVSWTTGTRDGSLIILGSVFTLMSDLIVGDVSFMDETGQKIEWRQIDREEWGKEKLPWAIPLYSYGQEKERLLKQIIRKHLLSQGMTLQGARVEICRASL